ncbi:MAG: PD-(D/E)XK nuclease family protein [Euryarchaeota archaeon]|nr:PD-(D/E)XK nuclease family protein [Euryarchaeota archaeon]
MRIPKYLSPTSLGKWESDQEEFYLQYLADKRPPRFPQTQPMAVGSAFDAYVKSYYHSVLFDTVDPRFEFETIFEEQVDEHNRDWARGAGEYTFECYKTSGALADLLKELQKAKSEPRFEFTLQEELHGVPLLGKPDLFFIHQSGTPIILDWKVNGFCSKYAKSPNRGFLRVRDGWVGVPSRGANSIHKDAHPMSHSGVIINIAEFLETINKEWATQLSTYAWLCGAEIGSEFVVALDQIVAKPDAPDKPKLRIAEHRCLVSADFQRKTMSRYSELWEIINSDHIFRDLSFADSATRCQTLDDQHIAFADDDDFVKEMTGRN